MSKLETVTLICPKTHEVKTFIKGKEPKTNLYWRLALGKWQQSQYLLIDEYLKEFGKNEEKGNNN